MIEICGVNKSFGSLQVLKEINLQIRDGEIVTIVGPSGAGKTTLLQIMGTLSPADSGMIRYSGEDVTVMKDKALSKFRNSHIGFVFQHEVAAAAVNHQSVGDLILVSAG